MLRIEGVVKGYRDGPVLRGVDLTVGPGEIVGMVGANGAGKTTLIGIAAGLRRADSGSVCIAGIDVAAHRRRAARHVGLAPQELGIYPTLTVAQNLECFARLAGLRSAQVRRRVAEVAEQLGLSDRLASRAGELSGGQKRRLHTGTAVLHRPDLVFLDEPTVGADVVSRREILDLVRRMAAEGTAVLYTTHHLTELEQLDATIAVLHSGRIVHTGPVADVISRWATTAVTLRFAHAAPALPGWRQEGKTLVPRAPVGEPGAAVGRALAVLGARCAELTGVEISRPGLETAYLAITGHTLTEGDDSAHAA